ncbi:MAG TPA: helix-turn-helix transcriptional regulator [Terriglobia bacterium]|nr:helix-turn-helix transcriptional regulator [Terriglobia bacterium]
MQLSTSSTAAQWMDLETRLFGLPLEELWARTSYDARVQNVRHTMETRYVETGLTITEISRACGMTVSNLNRIMRNLTGRTCYQLLISYRIHRSIKEALEINSSFAEIALHNGFDNSANYSRTVRRVLGWPPSKLIPRGPMFRRELDLPPLEDNRRPIKPASKEQSSHIEDTDRIL